MQTVLMHGPGISNPAEIVEREVPLADVNAYRAVGYVTGAKPVSDPQTDAQEAQPEQPAPRQRKRK